jgi:hypothetical protein
MRRNKHQAPHLHIDNDPTELHRDILEGADAIANYLYGDRHLRRRIYYLASSNSIPTFNLGATVCARKSTLIEWIREQEARSSNSVDGEANGKSQQTDLEEQ